MPDFQHLAFHDLETFSEVDLKAGTHAYAEPAEVMLWAYADGMDGQVKVWDVTAHKTPPVDLVALLQRPATRHVWHNGGMFDRTVLKHAMPELCDLIPEEAWWDTMVQALTHALPGGLDILCEIFNLPVEERKLKTGRDFINLFCKPRPKNSELRRATRHTHPEQWAGFVEYAGKDISSMRLLYHKIPKWNMGEQEHAAWLLDQRINQRGVRVDVDLARAAVDAVDRAQKDLKVRTTELTDGNLESTTKRDKMLAYLLAEHGVELPDLQKSTLERRIDDPNLPWGLRELLKVRLQATTTSTSKYKTLIKGASSDGRLRGLLQFSGAGRTRRFAGRLWQPQNLVRMNMDAVALWHGLPKDKVKDDHVDEYLATGAEAVRAGAADLLFDDVMALTSNLTRGCIVAPPGKKLVVADLANIEGRDAAWLAGEAWKLAAFREYDAGTGPDLYKLSYSKSFGVPVSEVNKERRQVGKVQELALGYQGGCGAFLTFALAYNIDLDEMAEQALPAMPNEYRAEAEGFYDWTRRKKRSTFGLEKNTFIACDGIKRGWREAHQSMAAKEVGMWELMENMARKAINTPGKVFTAGRLKFVRQGAWLRIGMPSGNCLCYPSPQVDESGKISYMGQNQYTRRWSRLSTYGGKLFENLCQAVARDILVANMFRIEAAGYEIVLSVHDELICEAPDSPEYSAEHLASLMATNPKWCLDLPLAAEGFEAQRYRKG